MAFTLRWLMWEMRTTTTKIFRGGVNSGAGAGDAPRNPWRVTPSPDPKHIFLFYSKNLFKYLNIAEPNQTSTLQLL